jgi:phosphoglycerol transferase MdoB-like AlkP superfamily enzyme
LLQAKNLKHNLLKAINKNESNKKTKMSQILNADFGKEDTIWLTKGKTLRKAIGILGMALPFLLILSLYFFSNFSEPLESISHYYYTRVSGVFIGILSILAIFLIIYKGKAPTDLIISTIAGVAVLFVLLFPTGNISEICHDKPKHTP